MEPWVTHAVWVMVGALISGLGAYITLGRSLAFIKGQLTQLIEVAKDLRTLEKDHHALRYEMNGHRRDIDQAHEKIRELREHITQ